MKILPPATLLVLLAILLSRPPHHPIRTLPAGITELHSEMVLDSGTELRGARAGSTLRAATDFSGRALIVVAADGVRLRDFTIDGNRKVLETRSELPPSDVPFARFTKANGILAANVADLAIEHVDLREIAGFAVLISQSRRVRIDNLRVTDSGSRNAAGKNNATGGILLEEGTSDFRVTGCLFERIRGNGLWTHSLYGSPRNTRGVFAANRFEEVGRDALQVGHATGVRVAQNSGTRIGFPIEMVDIEHLAVPAALDTAGNVENCAYIGNRFTELDGKCMDLDGFHDGEIRANECVNRAPPETYPYGNFAIVMNNSNPDMQSRNIRIVDNLIQSPLFGGIFVIGEGHQIAHNRFLNVNAAGCNESAAKFGCYYGSGEPDLLRSGIYLGRGADRPAPAQRNVIEDNRITGHGMREHCFGSAPGVSAEKNTIRANVCKD